MAVTKKPEVVKFENIETSMIWEAEVGTDTYKNMAKDENFARVTEKKDPPADPNAQQDPNAAKTGK